MKRPKQQCVVHLCRSASSSRSEKHHLHLSIASSTVHLADLTQPHIQFGLLVSLDQNVNEYARYEHEMNKLT